MDEHGDISRLERWVSDHQQTVYRAAVLILRDPDDAQDVAQDTFLRAHRAAGRVPSEADERPWLYRIAVNLALNRLRSARREAGALSRIGAYERWSDEAEDAATRDTVRVALRKLPDRLRVPVVLKYYLDLSERDIARALALRPGTVKSRLHEARTLLAGDESVVAAANESEAS